MHKKDKVDKRKAQQLKNRLTSERRKKTTASPSEIALHERRTTRTRTAGKQIYLAGDGRPADLSKAHQSRQRAHAPQNVRDDQVDNNEANMKGPDPNAGVRVTSRRREQDKSIPRDNGDATLSTRTARGAR